MSIAMPRLLILQLLLLLLLTSSVFIVSASATLSGSFSLQHSTGVGWRSGDHVVFESALPGKRLSRGSASKQSPDRTKSNDQTRGKQQTQSPGNVVDVASARRVPVGGPPPPKSSGRITLPLPLPPSELGAPV